MIDGQQRLRALLDFYGNKYALSKAVENVGGKRFSQLSDEQQKQIERSSFLCEVSKSIADEDVLEVFARVNTYSVGLNAQELRNGKYFGLFDEKSRGPTIPPSPEISTTWRRSTSAKANARRQILFTSGR